jgi:hypothetical protein
MDVVIPVQLVEILRGNLQAVVIKNVKQIDTRQAATRMPGFGCINNAQDSFAIQNRFLCQPPERFWGNKLRGLGSCHE